MNKKKKHWTIFSSNVLLLELYGLPRLRTFDLILFHLFDKYKAGIGQEDNILTDISATLWMIWTNRNKVIFENKIVDVQQAISSTRNLLKKWKADLDDCIQIGSTIAVTIGNQIPCQNQNWQAIIIVDTKKCSCKANWNGGAFVIKNRLGHFVRKGCYSWHSCNDENNLLSTTREALYEAWKHYMRRGCKVSGR